LVNKSTLYVLAVLSGFVLLTGCNHTRIQKIRRLNDTIESPDTFPNRSQSLDEKITFFMEHQNSKAAELLIDSLIKKNPQNASLYYEKGVLCIYDFHLEDGLINFRIAEKLGFSKKLCERQIYLWEKVLHGKSHYKSRANNTVI